MAYVVEVPIGFLVAGASLVGLGVGGYRIAERRGRRLQQRADHILHSGADHDEPIPSGFASVLTQSACFMATVCGAFMLLVATFTLEPGVLGLLTIALCPTLLWRGIQILRRDPRAIGPFEPGTAHRNMAGGLLLFCALSMLGLMLGFCSGPRL